MLRITAGCEEDFARVRAALVVSAALSQTIAAGEPAAPMPRRPLPSWLGARRRQPIPFPAGRALLRRPA